MDFREAIGDIVRLAKCFWRFEDVEPVFQTVMKNFSAIMEKRRRSMDFYISQIDG